MSTPSYNSKTKKTLHRRGWYLLCVGMMIGTVVTATILITTLGGNDASSTTANASGEVMCPEYVGSVAVDGITVYAYATCANNLSIVPAGAGPYDMQVLGLELISFMGTGTARVIGDGRLNIDMGGNPDIEAWKRAMVSVV